MTTTAAPAQRYSHFIDGTGHARADTDVIERIAPATGQVVSIYAAGDAVDVDRAVASARRTFESGSWSQAPGLQRGRVLVRLSELMREHRDELAALDAVEVGKPLRVARNDVDGAIDLVFFAGSLASAVHGDIHTNLGADFTGLLVREPIGVVGAIVPWNFPILILCQKLAFALAAGCSVVAKPSEYSSASAVRLAELAIEAGLPAGAYNVVTGAGQAGQALAEHMDVDMITFTGSTATGRRVLDASRGNLKKTALELGGKAAQIVFADADLDDAVAGVVFAATHNQGECCVAGTRLLVQSSIADEFSRRLVDRMRRLKVGGGDTDADFGAMIHPGHLDKVLDAVATAQRDGAHLLTGGHRLHGDGYDAGLFLEPTVLADVAADSATFQEEIFGPVLAVTPFGTVDEAVELANGVRYGLANTVWTKNIDTAHAVTMRLKSGTVYLNTTIEGAPQMSFGGYKASGYGREMGRAGLEEFTELKAIAYRSGKRTDAFGLREA